MSINLNEAEIGQELQEGIDYIWRVTGVSAVQSKAGNLYLKVTASVAEGPSVGQVAPFPYYTFMLYDAGGEKTAQYIDRSRQLMAKIIGIAKEEIQDIPDSAGDVSESMELLLNSLFEAPAEWQEPQGDYPGRWFVGRVTRPVLSDEVVAPDWSAFFNTNNVDADEPPF